MTDLNGGKKSYSPAEVENYIKKTIQSYENKLSEQKERIFELLEENEKLLAELEKYRDKDSQISKALVHAIAKAKEIEDGAKLKYNIEIEKLKNFHSKWVSYYATVKNKLPKTEDMLSAEEFLYKMDNVLGLESPELKGSYSDPDAAAQHSDENIRLGKKIINDNSAATVPPEYDSGLDMNEVLNPKNLPELDQLIKEMGILDR